MADIAARLSPSRREEMEDEILDPRIQEELERLNKASEEINRLELELDDARAAFRQALSDSTYKLDALAKKLGSCVDRSRPYYDARMKAKEVHVETQKAAYMFERACSMHEAAKEMVQLAEQGYQQREDSTDPAWQEMLNHATMKVNEAEVERAESEEVHMRTTMQFKQAEDLVQKLQKDLKRSINKSKSYFEMKAKFNQVMEEHKRNVNSLEEGVAMCKKTYSDALHNLEEISEAIHHKRLEMQNHANLGIREAGVGSESPSPPPLRGKDHVSIDGQSMKLVSNCSAVDNTNTVTSTQFGASGISSQEFKPLSVIYSSAEKACRESYKKAIEVKSSFQQNSNSISDDDKTNLEEKFMPLSDGNTQRQFGKDEADDVFCDRTSKKGNEVRKEQNSGMSTSSSSRAEIGKKSTSKLQGLILVPVGAGQDPLQAHLCLSNPPVSKSHTMPSRPVSLPVDSSNRTSISVDSQIKSESGHVRTPGSLSGRQILRISSNHELDEGSISDTDSVTSITMLDDDQVEFLTMDFSNEQLDEVNREHDHQEFRRMTLPMALTCDEHCLKRVSDIQEEPDP